MTQTSPAAARQLDAIPVHRKSLSQRLRENWQLYVMLLIPVVLTIVYKYWPMYGIQIAFRDFKASRGITGSEWVGLYWFERFFTAPNCAHGVVAHNIQKIIPPELNQTADGTKLAFRVYHDCIVPKNKVPGIYALTVPKSG